MNISLDGFFKELINRLFAKSPKFFVIIKWVGIACGVITGLPALLTGAGIVLPPAILELQNTAVSWAGIVGAFIASLTVSNATVLADKTTALPFTEKNEVPPSETLASVKPSKIKKEAPVKKMTAKGGGKR